MLVAVAVFLLNSTVGLLTNEFSTGLPFSSSAKLILPNRRKVIITFVHGETSFRYDHKLNEQTLSSYLLKSLTDQSLSNSLFLLVA